MGGGGGEGERKGRKAEVMVEGREEERVLGVLGGGGLRMGVGGGVGGGGSGVEGGMTARSLTEGAERRPKKGLLVSPSNREGEVEEVKGKKRKKEKKRKEKKKKETIGLNHREQSFNPATNQLLKRKLNE